MPVYRVTDPQTGKSYKLTGSTPPTEQELNQVFSSAPKAPVKASIPRPTIAGTVASSLAGPVGMVASGLAGDEYNRGMTENIIKSGAKNVQGIGESVLNVLNPDMNKNTIANLFRLGTGAVQKLVPGQQGNEAYADNVIQFYKDRYSPQNIERTAYEDPAGVALDASAVLGGVSGVTKVGSKVVQNANLANKLGTISKTAGVASEVLDPISMVTRGLNKTGKYIEKSGKEYGLRGLRPTATQQANFLSKTGIPLEEFMAKYNLYGDPVEMAQKVIAPLQERFDDLTIKSGKTLSKSEILNIFDEEIAKYTKNTARLDPASRAVGEFLKSEKDNFVRTYKGVKEIGADEIVGARRMIDENTPSKQFDVGGHGKQKAVGTTFRKAQYKVSPESKVAGKELSNLYAFKEIADKQSKLGRGTKPFTFAKAGGATVGGVIGGIKGAIAGAVLEKVVNNPYVVGATSKGVAKVGKLATKSSKVAKPLVKTGVFTSRLTPVSNTNNDPLKVPDFRKVKKVGGY